MPLLTVTTQFRVMTVGTPRATSPIVIVGVAVRVGVKVNHTAGPSRRPRPVLRACDARPTTARCSRIQRLKNGQWVTVQGGSLQHASTTSSRYRKTLHIRHFGKYRVFVGVNNQNTSGISREIRIRKRG